MAGDVGRRGAVAEFEALLCGLEEEVRVYVVEQGEDGVHPVSGFAVEGVEHFGDPSLGDALQGGGRRLQLLGTDVGTEFVFEFHLTRKGYCSAPFGVRGSSLNHCACARDVRLQVARGLVAR